MADAKLGALGLGWFPDTLGLILWAIIIGLAYLVYRLARKREYVFAVLAGVPMLGLLWLPASEYLQYRQYMAKVEPAKAIFDKLCAEQSRPIIKRTVEDVEGVLLLKVRRETKWDYQDDPNWPEAALPSFARVGTKHNKGLAEHLLWDWYLDSNANDGTATAIPRWQYRSSVGEPAFRDPNIKGMRALFRGYRFVDIPDADGVTRRRMTAHLTSEQSSGAKSIAMSEFEQRSTQEKAPRYGVTFEDNLDPALRKHWIAGTTIKVVDTQDNDVIGQQTFWKWDRGFGARPEVGHWSTNAAYCPNQANPMTLIHSTLKAKQGN